MPEPSGAYGDRHALDTARDYSEAMDRVRERESFLKGKARATLRKAARDLAEHVGVLGALASRNSIGMSPLPSVTTDSAASEARTDHSPDFTSVNWFGRHYYFSRGQQAESVRALWEAWEGGKHRLSLEAISVRVDSSAGRFELGKVFRKKRSDGRYDEHPAWGTMIRSVGRGYYALVEPLRDSSAENP